MTELAPVSPAAAPGPGRFFLGFLVALLGGSLLWWSLRNLSQAEASEAWPSAPGRIVSSAVYERFDHDGRRQFSSHVSYEYAANGARYVSSRVSFGDYASSSRAHAQAIADRYPLGTAVAVFFRPDNPSEAVLEKGISGSVLLVPIVGFVFAAAGVLIFAGVLRPRRFGGTQML